MTGDARAMWRWVLCFLLMVSTVIVGAIAAGCRRGADRDEIHPLLLVGVDGGEWKVIEWLWSQGRMPNLKALCERGVSGPLQTFHHASPVIWTTVATGVCPEVHGITEFVVPTASGDRPVASSLRRVPALWNMASAAGRRVAAAGWWASWPAEEVNGVVISDRAIHDIEDRVFPATYLPAFLDEIDTALEAYGDRPALIKADVIMAHCARSFVAEQYDLVMVYFRGVDLACHFDWKYFEPERFSLDDPDEIRAGRARIAAEYELVDDSLGRLLEAAGGRYNVIVMSDHGFEAMRDEELRILLNLDDVLLRFGYLKRSADGVDLAKSRLYSYASPERELVKKVRYALAGRDPGGRVGPRQRPRIRERLESDLARVTYGGGMTAFRVRDATAAEVEDGADLVVEVLRDGARAPLLIDGKPFRKAIKGITRLSGTHGAKTPGIFVAAGPDIARQPDPGDLRVIDVTPTVLYALGLPVAECFAGRPRTDLMSETFRRGQAVRTIPTWGEPRAGSVRASGVDDELIEQLRALGYLD